MLCFALLCSALLSGGLLPTLCRRYGEGTVKGGLQHAGAGHWAKLAIPIPYIHMCISSPPLIRCGFNRTQKTPYVARGFRLWEMSGPKPPKRKKVRSAKVPHVMYVHASSTRPRLRDMGPRPRPSAHPRPWRFSAISARRQLPIAYHRPCQKARQGGIRLGFL